MRVWISLLFVGCATPPEGAGPTSEPVLSDALGSCVYINTFSGTEECKEYVGESWTAETATADCEAPMPGASAGSLSLDAGCDRSSILGECLIDTGLPEETVLVFPGEAGDPCDGLSIGCGFAGGEFIPSELCDAEAVAPSTDNVFKPFEIIRISLEFIRLLS